MLIWSESAELGQVGKAGVWARDIQRDQDMLVKVTHGAKMNSNRQSLRHQACPGRIEFRWVMYLKGKIVEREFEGEGDFCSLTARVINQPGVEVNE